MRISILWKEQGLMIIANALGSIVVVSCSNSGSLHFPRSFPADIMHCVLQNITPTLYKIWNRTKLEVDNPKSHGNSRKPYYLDVKVLEVISSSLTMARSDIPAYLSHTPHQISNHYAGFKAVEWKAWLTLFGMPLLDQYLGQDYIAKLSHS